MPNYYPMSVVPSILLSIVLCLFSFNGSAQQIAVAKKPTWITEVNYSTALADTLGAGDSYWLLYERQYNVAEQATYTRIAEKALSASGLESISAISVNYDPSFQRLVFHSVNIHRDSTVINKLINNSFDVIRREQSLERLVYDKSLDAIMNLDDVQIGDIVEYSYSLIGTNPVFQKKFYKTFYLNYSVPVGHLFINILYPNNRPLITKGFNSAAKAVRTEKNGNTSLQWSVKNAAAILMEDETPSWFDPYDYVQVTESKTWKDVKDWALPLYSVNADQGPAVQKKIQQIIKANVSKEEQIKACIRFVQDEVRYLAFSDGIRGFKPNSPEKVFAQRFGDCKDKSLLLSFMLNRIGIESFPALANTQTGKNLPNDLPSPTAFDHCIVYYQYHDSSFWVDATRTLQRGSIQSLRLTNYEHALIISPKSSSLTAIDQNELPSQIRITEEYFIDTVGRGARLLVTTVFSGREANSTRNYWKSTSAALVKKNYTNFYASDYSDIQMVKPVVFHDNEQNNIMTTSETYLIKDIWAYDSLASKYSLEVYPRYINDYLTIPSSKNRTMPYALRQPVAIEQTIKVHLPEPWEIEADNKVASGKGFKFESRSICEDSVVTLTYQYKITEPYITPEAVTQYIKQIDNVRGRSFFLYYDSNKTLPPATSTSRHILVMCLVIGGLTFLGMFRLYKLDPRAGNYRVAHDAIGGTLVFLAIVIFAWPLFGLSSFLGNNNFFSTDLWSMLTNRRDEMYWSADAYKTLADLVIHILLLGYSLLLILLWAEKRTSFPRLAAIFFVANFCSWALRKAMYGSLAFNAAFIVSTFLVMTIYGALIAYVLLSERVTGTFRQRLN